MKMRRILGASAALAALLLLGACNSQKGPADAAIKAAEGAIASVKGEAQRWVPDQEKAAEEALRKAKEQFQKGDFQGALTFAKDAAAQARELGAAAIAKKAERTAAWDDVSAGLPKTVDAVRARVDDLSKLKKLPKGIDKQALAKGQEGLAALQSAWGDAQKAFTSGDLAGAIEQATGVKTKGAELMTLLGMPNGAAPAEAPAPAPAPAAKKAKKAKK